MQEYVTIKQARAMLQASRAGMPSAQTVAGYEAKTRRIVDRAGQSAGIDELIAQAKQTQSAATWFSRRAALMHSFRAAVDRLLAEQDTMQRAIKAAQSLGRPPDLVAWQKTVRKIGRMTEWHERLRNEPGPEIEQRRPRHSKRKDLRGLPADWRERMVARLPNYRLAVLVQAVTGCRPDELVNGVQLEIQSGYLVATIKGSKVTAKTGQPWRRLLWQVDSESPLVRHLVAAVQAGASMAKIENAKAYSGAVRAAGAREWPRRKTTVTPYCFRHAAASDMKASGIDKALISQALGHCSDITKQYYGSWHQARGGSVSPNLVEAARAVQLAKKPSFSK
jgi:integrase